MNRGGHMAGLAQTLIRAYDVAILENIRTRKRNKSTGNLEGDTDRVEMPYLVKLTATTWESFVTRATIDNVLDGFLARFVFVTGAALPRRVELEDATMREEFDELIRLAADYYKRAGWVRDIEPGEDVLEAALEARAGMDGTSAGYGATRRRRPSVETSRRYRPEGLCVARDRAGRQRAHFDQHGRLRRCTKDGRALAVLLTAGD